MIFWRASPFFEQAFFWESLFADSVPSHYLFSKARLDRWVVGSSDLDFSIYSLTLDFPSQTEMEPSSSDFHRDVDYVLLCGCHIHLGWKSDLYVSLLYLEAWGA